MGPILKFGNKNSLFVVYKQAKTAVNRFTVFNIISTLCRAHTFVTFFQSSRVFPYILEMGSIDPLYIT